MKPEGFSIENLYNNLEAEASKVRQWQPMFPIEVLKAVVEYKKKMEWTQIIEVLEKSGITTTYAQLKHQIAKAREHKLLDSE